MQHLFLPYELALKAKEKGFNETCLACYAYGRESEGVIVATMDVNNDRGYTAAPLYQQIIDWFLKEYDFYVS